MEKTKNEKNELQSVVDSMDTEKAEVMAQIQELTEQHAKISGRFQFEL